MMAWAGPNGHGSIGFSVLQIPPSFSFHSHQPTPTSPSSIISNNNKLPAATEHLQWSLSRSLLCVGCCCVNFISFSLRFQYPAINNPPYPTKFAHPRLLLLLPYLQLSTWQTAQEATCLLVQDPPAMQQLRPSPHLRDFLVPTVPGCLTPLKRSAGIRTLTDTSEQLIETFWPLISSNTKQLLFDSPQALGGHQNAHKHERAAQRNLPATHQQRYHPPALFPADQHQQHTSSIPFPHSPGMDPTVGAARFVNVWPEPIQPRQHLPSSSVPHQSFLGVSTTPDALSPTADVDDSSADIDLTLRL
ncbi:hypothetical protein SLEP1_g53568 [Rubroshorea leprosula]|uniref:Uncharacterized protein n=1 Tax=Rubroshorea leprosula TaxID=152421 RepID=A0AAV5M9Z1_9ROSI|nr:hypothetical protein SLEP1_g53568 [Rubroshorea leprosula]